MEERGYQLLEHTADVALRVWAPTEEELLQEGARALVVLLTEGSPVAVTGSRRVELECLDSPDRFVRWLNEVLYLAVVDGFLLARARLELAPERLVAELDGELDGLDRIAQELKSVTYHALVVEQRGDRWVAEVVIDT